MSSPVKSLSLDPISTFLVREFIDICMADIHYQDDYVARYMSTAYTSQKHAIISPLLKKPGLDTADMGNYRPVSNLPFMFTVVERAVAGNLKSERL